MYQRKNPARFQLENQSAPARLGSARNLHSSGSLEPEKSSSNPSLRVFYHLSSVSFLHFMKMITKVKLSSKNQMQSQDPRSFITFWVIAGTFPHHHSNRLVLCSMYSIWRFFAIEIIKKMSVFYIPGKTMQKWQN